MYHSYQVLSVELRENAFIFTFAKMRFKETYFVIFTRCGTSNYTILIYGGKY